MIKKNSIFALGCLIPLVTGIQSCATVPAISEADTAVEVPALELTQTREITHTVGPHERLGDIALKYTGSTTNWLAIAKYNRLSDPHKIRIGTRVTIPPSLLPQNNPALAKQPSSTSVTSPSLAIKTQQNNQRPTNATVPKTRTQGPVVIQTVSTNRSFKLTPLDEAKSKTRPSQSSAKVKVVGSYYPKGIYQQPANYSTLIMRAAPGTMFELEYLANDWYKVVTSEGTGYLREADGKVVLSNKKP